MPCGASSVVESASAEVDPAAELQFSEFLRRDAQGAASFAEAIVKNHPDQGRWWCYVACARERTGDPTGATDAFVRGSCLSTDGFLDCCLMYARAHALVGIKAYARAQEVLDALADRFPYSQLAAKDLAFSLAVSARLAQGITRSNLAWYWDQARSERGQGKPGVAADHLEEYLLLDGRAHILNDEERNSARLLVGELYLSLGAPGKALAHFELVDQDAASGRSALFRSLALIRLNRYAEALVSAQRARASSDPRVAAEAEAVFQLVQHASHH